MTAAWRRAAGTCLALCCAALALAEGMRPAPVLPDSAAWTQPPAVPGLRFAWLLGAQDKAGAYLLRVRLAAGTRIPPHTHPDERHSTVLAGTLHVGFGERFDEAALVAVPAGAVYVAPARVPHYLWARDGAVEYQEAGTGPTATTMLQP